MTDKDEYREIQMEIQGMTWTGWEPKVVQALEGLEGVKKATASHPEKKAVVLYNTASVTLEHMRNALLKAGYVASFGNNEKSDNLKPLSGMKNEFHSDDLVCYCFKFTRNDIEQDYIKNGQSTIIAKISSEKKSGGCDCANKNPKGRWCLVDVRQVVDKLKGRRWFNTMS